MAEERPAGGGHPEDAAPAPAPAPPAPGKQDLAAEVVLTAGATVTHPDGTQE